MMLWSDEIHRRIVDLRKAGKPWDVIAAEFGIRRNALHRRIAAAKLTPEQLHEIGFGVQMGKSQRLWSREKVEKVAALLGESYRHVITPEIEKDTGMSRRSINRMIEAVRAGTDDDLKALFPRRTQMASSEERSKAAALLWQKENPRLSRDQIADRLGITVAALIGIVFRCRKNPDPEVRALFPAREDPAPTRKKKGSHNTPSKALMPRKTGPAPARMPMKLAEFEPPPVREADPFDQSKCCWPMTGAVDRYGRSVAPDNKRDSRPGLRPLMCGNDREPDSIYCKLHNLLSIKRDQGTMADEAA